METITINQDQLAAALAQWETEAKEGKWPDRPNDPERHQQNAKYLMGLLDPLDV